MCSKWGCIEISYCLHEIVVDTQKSHFMMVSHTHKIVSQMEANHLLPTPSWHMVTTLSSAQQTILLPSVSSRSCGEEHPWNQNRVGALTLIARGLHLPITQSLQKSFPNLAYTESPQELFKNRFSGPTPTSTATESLGLEPKNCTVQNALQVILSAASPQLTIWPTGGGEPQLSLIEKGKWTQNPCIVSLALLTGEVLTAAPGHQRYAFFPTKSAS